ncbi:hypothetical protein BDV97DRAFT_399953 [Delphinella strobiligena]|nr:hypothetical protein BDV97DRAFT_399953 [Delphinella strobiligena]
MESLPDEIVIQILSLLDASELVSCQQLSRRFCELCRDNTIWKQECFNASRAEAKRRRQLIDSSTSPLATLRYAFAGWSGPDALEGNISQPARAAASSARSRALANWDPAYPNEKPNYYQEYIHRHAPINVGWLRIPSLAGEGSEPNEATGVGLLQHTESGSPQHIVAPLDDGSISIWDIQPRETGSPPSQGNVVGRSAVGLLSGTDPTKHSLANIRSIMTETGAVESVSIDSWQKRGYFAHNNTLVQVDLATLQAVSHESFPFPITALSQTHQNSLVVGTNNTIHLHDPRNRSKSSIDPSLTVEVIGGPTASHVTLSQPGPLSILNHTEDDLIWVAGRFTHLLNYDRRFFPRLRGTVHSGARISCLATLPYSLIARSMDLLQDPSLSIQDLYTAKSTPGTTLFAAGEYKGKGSLEYYNMSRSSTTSIPRTTNFYQNRQTASSNKLLAVASHGLSTVFSDGDGNLKWVERDGSTAIRTHNINDYADPPSFNQSQSQAQIINLPDQSAQGDIVQKILPLEHSQPPSSSSKRIDSNQSDLLLKTGDGRIGILGFGHESLYGKEELEEIVESTEERARKDAERSYQDSMGRLLQRHADEMRYLRLSGLRMPF